MFRDRHAQLDAEDAEDANPEGADEYLAFNNSWIPPDVRWVGLQAAVRQLEIGAMLDDATRAIEHDQPTARYVPPTDFADPAVGKVLLGQLIETVGKVSDVEACFKGRTRDILLSRWLAASPGASIHEPARGLRQ